MANRGAKKAAENVTEVFIRQIEAARGRIGKSRIDELEWVLNFAYTSLDRISDGQRGDLTWEAVAFSFSKDKPRPPITTGMGYFYEGHIDLDHVKTFQSQIRAGFDAFFSRARWHYRTPAVDEYLSFGRPPQKFEDIKELGFPSIHRGRIRHAFDLLRDEQDRVRICDNPKCARAFVTRKKDRGRFCKPGCNAYFRITTDRITARLGPRPEPAQQGPLDPGKRIALWERKRVAKIVRWAKSIKEKHTDPRLKKSLPPILP